MGRVKPDLEPLTEAFGDTRRSQQANVAAACRALARSLKPLPHAVNVAAMAAGLAKDVEPFDHLLTDAAEGTRGLALGGGRAAAADVDRGGALVDLADLLVVALLDDVVGEAEELQLMQLLNVAQRPSVDEAVRDEIGHDRLQRPRQDEARLRVAAVGVVPQELIEDGGDALEQRAPSVR